MTEEADLDGLSDLNTLSFLYENLASIFASVSAVQTGYSVLFGVVTLFEWLQGGHQVVTTSDTVSDHSLGDTCCYSTLDDGSDGIHGTDDLGLVLRWDVKLDLLEEVLRGTETTDDQNILSRVSLLVKISRKSNTAYLK